MRKWVAVPVVLAALSAAVLLRLEPGTAAQAKPTGSVRVGTTASPTAKALEDKGRTMVMTLLRDGKPVRQSETMWREWYNFIQWQVPPGTYDLRVESEGVQTIFKEGIFVTEGEQTDVSLSPELGSGCKVITYSTAELSQLGKSCSASSAHLNASPDRWQFCPVCGKKLQ